MEYGTSRPLTSDEHAKTHCDIASYVYNKWNELDEAQIRSQMRSGKLEIRGRVNTTPTRAQLAEFVSRACHAAGIRSATPETNDLPADMNTILWTVTTLTISAGHAAHNT
ncbi:MAG: hypothetical protein OXN44_13360 [Acidimicrobiaceae bacterium]|nr:hypothetical protein [Acidimicrobiaceae bacterium]